MSKYDNLWNWIRENGKDSFKRSEELSRKRISGTEERACQNECGHCLQQKLYQCLIQHQGSVPWIEDNTLNFRCLQSSFEKLFEIGQEG